MQNNILRSQQIQSLSDLEENAVLDLVKQRITNGDDPLQIIEDCNEGMQLVGKRFEKGQYYISGLIMSGEIFGEVVEMVQPLLKTTSKAGLSGRVLVGTVKGDIHDIGKNMVGMLLSCYGFAVTDLGVDVSPEDFAVSAISNKPDIVGLSGLITASIEYMKETVAVLKKETQMHSIHFPIIIGGSMLDERAYRYVGADYWVTDAMEGVRLCKSLMER